MSLARIVLHSTPCEAFLLDGEQQKTKIKLYAYNKIR